MAGFIDALAQKGIDTKDLSARIRNPIKFRPKGGLEIEIDEPWAGSTETGFGATTSIRLSKEDVARVLAWLRT